MKIHAEVLEVRPHFELLRGDHDEVYHVRSMTTIYFRTLVSVEWSIGIEWYYQAQVKYEFDRDHDRREEFGSDKYYMAHIIALGDMNPVYNRAVSELLGTEIHDMLQLSWREEEIGTRVNSGEYDFDAAYAARDLNQMSREVYEISPGDAAIIIDRLFLNR